MKKYKILVLSHGDLAETMVKTSKLILGEVPEICYINMPEVLDSALYCEKIVSVLKNSENGEILILTDLLGGSPFLYSSQILKDHFEKVELITGYNLPMLLEVGCFIKEKTIKELKEIAIEAGKNGIIDFKEKFGDLDNASKPCQN